jgi:hypothetical protein
MAWQNPYGKNMEKMEEKARDMPKQSKRPINNYKYDRTNTPGICKGYNAGKTVTQNKRQSL